MSQNFTVINIFVRKEQTKTSFLSIRKEERNKSVGTKRERGKMRREA